MAKEVPPNQTVKHPPSLALKRLAEEPATPVTAVDAAQRVLRNIARLERRINPPSPAEILAAVRWQLEGIVTDRAGQFMRQLQDWEARQ